MLNSDEDNDYWARLDKLLNTKFESFENKLTSKDMFKKNIAHNVDIGKIEKNEFAL